MKEKPAEIDVPVELLLQILHILLTVAQRTTKRKCLCCDMKSVQHILSFLKKIEEIRCEQKKNDRENLLGT